MLCPRPRPGCFSESSEIFCAPSRPRGATAKILHAYSQRYRTASSIVAPRDISGGWTIKTRGSKPVVVARSSVGWTLVPHTIPRMSYLVLFSIFLVLLSYQMYHVYHKAVAPFIGWAGFIGIVCTSYDIGQTVVVSHCRLCSDQGSTFPSIHLGSCLLCVYFTFVFVTCINYSIFACLPCCYCSCHVLPSRTLH